jgi:hypothetical protein
VNFVIKVPKLEQYTIYGVRRVMDGYAVRSTTVDAKDRVLASADIDFLPTLEEANEQAERIALMKAALKGRLVVDSPPAYVKRHFERDDQEWVTNQQMTGLLTAAKRERYVIFRDVKGMESRFDIGVQYLALDTGDEETLDVTDNFGETSSCLKGRFVSVELTEAGKEVEAIELRGKRREAKEVAREMKKERMVM